MSGWQAKPTTNSKSNYLPKMSRKPRTIQKIAKRPLVTRFCDQTYQLGVSYFSTDVTSAVHVKKIRAIPRYTKPITKVTTNSQIPIVTLHSIGSAEIKNQTVTAAVSPNIMKILDSWKLDVPIQEKQGPTVTFGDQKKYVPAGEKNLANKRLSSLMDKLRGPPQNLSTSDYEKNSVLLQINEQLDQSLLKENLSKDVMQNSLYSSNQQFLKASKTNQNWLLSKTIFSPSSSILQEKFPCSLAYEDSFIVTNIYSGCLCATKEYSSQQSGALASDTNKDMLNKLHQPCPRSNFYNTSLKSSEPLQMNSVSSSLNNIDSEIGISQQSRIGNDVSAFTSSNLESLINVQPYVRPCRSPEMPTQEDISKGFLFGSLANEIDNGKQLHRQLILLQKLKSGNESLLSVLGESNDRVPPTTEECRNCYKGSHTCRHCPRILKRPCETCDICTI